MRLLMTQLADEILIAYADGELGPEQTRLVDGVLNADRHSLERFQHQLALNKRLAKTFSSMLQAQTRQAAVEFMADRAQKAERRSLPQPQVSKTVPNKKLMVPAFAAGAMLLAVGGLGGYMAGNGGGANSGADPFGSGNFWNNEQAKSEAQRSTELLKKITRVKTISAPTTTAATVQVGRATPKRWYEALASRHKKDAAQLIDRYEGKSRNKELALFQFNNQDVAPELIPALKEDQLVFIGASLIRAGGQQYARLTYRDISNGAVPVGLYVGTNNGGSLTLERGYDGDDNYVRWTQGQRSYMLIGPVPHWRLIVLSVAVQRQIVQ